MNPPDTSLRKRCLKYEGNNHLRVDAFVVRLSSLSTPELQAKCGMKMCNDRRAAERILAWREANPNFQIKTEHRPQSTQATGRKTVPASGISGGAHTTKRLNRPPRDQRDGSGSAGTGHDAGLASGNQQRAASAMPVVVPLSTPCRLDLALVQDEHRRLCAMKGIRTRSFANAAAVPFPYTEGSSGTSLPSTVSGRSVPPKAAATESALTTTPH